MDALAKRGEVVGNSVKRKIVKKKKKKNEESAYIHA